MPKHDGVRPPKSNSSTLKNGGHLEDPASYWISVTFEQATCSTSGGYRWKVSTNDEIHHVGKKITMTHIGSMGRFCIFTY